MDVYSFIKNYRECLQFCCFKMYWNLTLTYLELLKWLFFRELKNKIAAVVWFCSVFEIVILNYCKCTMQASHHFFIKTWCL